MERKWQGWKLRLSIGMILFIGGLSVIGYVLHAKLYSLLYSYMETQLSHHAIIMAECVDEKMEAELKNLELFRKSVSQFPYKSDEIIHLLSDKHERYGILSSDGRIITGTPIDTAKYPGIKTALSGKLSISGNIKDGILFCMPLAKDGEKNITSLVYKLFLPNSITDKFGFRYYDGYGSIWVSTEDNIDIIPPIMGEEKQKIYLQSAKETGLFEKIDHLIAEGNRPSAAIYGGTSGSELFLFKTKLKSIDAYLWGFVPAPVISQTLDDARTLIIAAFLMLLILVASGSVYIFLAEEKVRQGDALKAVAEQESRANNAKSTFLANMSHEIRTPINAIMGMTEMILRESKEKFVLEYAKNIDGASRALLALVNDILDFSKVEAGKMEIVSTSYRLGQLLNEVAVMINIKAEEKKLTFLVNVDSSLPDELEGDPDRIRQVLLNLLSNAVKYTKEGGVTLTVSGERKDNSTIVFSFAIADTGLGIKPEDMGKLFKNFVRLDLRKNRSVEGTGLGLALTQRFTEMMNGKIDVTSEYGVGSTFTLILPQKILGDTPVGNFKVQKAEQQNRATNYRASYIAPDAKILVVDDREINLLVVKGLLKETRIQITTALSGKGALELMQTNDFDVVLLDHMMPGLNGIETLEQAKKISGYESKPFIVLTANAIVGMREMYLEKGFIDYLSKPVDGNELEDTLRKYLPAEKIKSTPDASKNMLEFSAADLLSNIDSPIAPATNSETPEEKEPPEKPAAPPNIDEVDPELLAILNVERGYKNCGNKKNMFHNVLMVFCDEAANTKEEILTAFEKKDWEHFVVCVHALKSSSLLIGGEKLSRLAKRLEMAGRKIQGRTADNPPKDAEGFIANNIVLLMSLFDETVSLGRNYLENIPQSEK